MTDAGPKEWVMPTFNVLCGHQQLAEVVVRWRAWFSSLRGPSSAAGRELLADISDNGVRRLLEFAHFAGCIPDEGRYPRLALFVRSRASVGDLTYIVRYRDPVPLTVPKLLTELGTVLPPEGGCAIQLEEREGQLRCVGLVNLAGHLLVGQDGVRTQAAIGLQVFVDGPGRLRVREIDLDVQVQDGAIRSNQSIYEGRLATLWLEELREKSWEQCAAVETGLRKESHTYGWNTTVVAAWADVIMTVARMAHGGAIVVLPDAATSFVRIKYTVSPLSYLDEINAYLRLRSAPSQGGTQDAAFVAALDARHARLFAHAGSLAHLAAIDGCVVLDRDLWLHGYGGKIAADEAAQKSTLTFAEVESKKPRQEAEIFGRFGQRHRSAFNLCKAVPHALAFVLSQDGALRVFGSDASHVYLEEDMNPQRG